MIIRKSPEEIEKMAAAGDILSRTIGCWRARSVPA